jgi:queuosine precursor transporter
MYLNRKKWGLNLYLILSGIFIASLVTCNLIFQKFFYWTPLSFLLDESIFLNSILPINVIQFLGNYTFEISAGILPYPITFLVTDIISEIYGQKKANQLVKSGFIASIFILFVTMIAQSVPATSWSPVNDETFSKVFGLFGPAVFASMSAYLIAQFIDIRIFHFWKNLTKGKHLWLRNNGSTIFSQFIDTSAVLLLLCSFNVIEWPRFSSLLINGFLFKVIVAFLDTPLFYLASWYLKKSFGLGLNEYFQED